MSYETDLFIKACSDPNGYSDKCYPDGTPMSNRERYIELTDRKYDTWH